MTTKQKNRSRPLAGPTPWRMIAVLAALTLLVCGSIFAAVAQTNDNTDTSSANATSTGDINYGINNDININGNGVTMDNASGPSANTTDNVSMFNETSNETGNLSNVSTTNVNITNQTMPDFNLTVVSPQNLTYSDGNITVFAYTNTTVDQINVSSDGAASQIVCTNCSSISYPFPNVWQGGHNVTIMAMLGNISHNETRAFAITYPQPVLNLTNTTTTVSTASCPANDFVLTIQQPQNMTYNTANVEVLAATSRTVDKMLIWTDNGGISIACRNCSQFTQTLQALADGQHTVHIAAIWGSVYHEQSATFTVDTSAQNTVTSYAPPATFSLAVTSPQNGGTYQSSSIPVNIMSDQQLDLISMRLDANPYQTVCIHCSNFGQTLTGLSTGGHVLQVAGAKGVGFKEITVYFTVTAPGQILVNGTSSQTAGSSFSVNIQSPQNGATYNTPLVNGQITASQSLDSISAQIDNTSMVQLCTNCQQAGQTVSGLTYGTHTYRVQGMLAGQTQQNQVSFFVNLTYEQRFGSDFGGLADAVARGEISDAELAVIIRTHHLSDSVITALIKTGKLGDASIAAILDTQRLSSPNFIERIIYIFVPRTSVADQVFVVYNGTLTPQTAQRLLDRDDLSPTYITQVQNIVNNNISVNYTYNTTYNYGMNGTNGSGNGTSNTAGNQSTQSNQSNQSGLGTLANGIANGLTGGINGVVNGVANATATLPRGIANAIQNSNNNSAVGSVAANATVSNNANQSNEARNATYSNGAGASAGTNQRNANSSTTGTGNETGTTNATA